jgi:electron transfer flavoprotein alpha subunit
MHILVYLEQAEGRFKKASLEAASYAGELAKQVGGKSTALVLGSSQENLSNLGQYGITSVLHASDLNTAAFDARQFTSWVAESAQNCGANTIVLSHSSNGKAIASRLSVRLKAGLVAGAIAMPDTSNGFTVKKSVFSGKAFAHVRLLTDIKIISLQPNAITPVVGSGSATVEAIALTTGSSQIELNEVKKLSGEVSLTEADIVVSGGRGLKGPENWGLVTDLAELLGAATACSRPVADIHWRPHHEHVGQTGIAIAPNLYIAIGISGAIQHLAGVNRSKTIVVINKDPEAPFFKAADYGIVGDAFEVMPKIIDAVRKLKETA